MRNRYDSIEDYVISACAIVLAGLVLWAAREIPPPFFDPLGSAALPKACASLLIVIALGISVRRYFANKAPSAPKEDEDYKPEPWLALAVVGLSVLYTLGMGTGWLGYRWGTILYITVTGSLLAKKDPKVMGLSLVLGILFGVGGQYLFTQFFYIDLP